MAKATELNLVFVHVFKLIFESMIRLMLPWQRLKLRGSKMTVFKNKSFLSILTSEMESTGIN